MSDDSNIPILTDLIESGDRIDISELGLDEDLGVEHEEPRLGDTGIELDVTGPDAADPFRENPALEQTVRRILDEHMELAWQEIKLAIQRELNK